MIPPLIDPGAMPGAGLDPLDPRQIGANWTPVWHVPSRLYYTGARAPSAPWSPDLAIQALSLDTSGIGGIRAWVLDRTAAGVARVGWGVVPVAPGSVGVASPVDPRVVDWLDGQGWSVALDALVVRWQELLNTGELADRAANAALIRERLRREQATENADRWRQFLADLQENATPSGDIARASAKAIKDAAQSIGDAVIGAVVTWGVVSVVRAALR